MQTDKVWQRVASTKPRLREDVQLARRYYRDQLWYVLHDAISGRFHRFTPDAYHAMSLMDGDRTVGDIYQQLIDEFGEDAPDKESLIHLLQQIIVADIVHTDAHNDHSALLHRKERQSPPWWKRLLMNPLSLRLPFFDPDAFLAKGISTVKPFFSPFAIIVWLVVVITALALTAIHWNELTENIIDRVTTPQNLILLWLIYPFIKILHELGHGFAAKYWGGEVHETGVVFMLGIPFPYMDATAASGFKQKYQRVMVGAAGMYVELFLAAIALFIWIQVEPGLVRTLAYNVILIGSVSTLFFNGNPLMRFDGYYILSDAIDIPNLGRRASQYMGYLVRRYLYRLKKTSAPATAKGERAWFVAYGFGAFLYRSFITLFIVFMVAQQALVLGIVLGVWLLIIQAILPLYRFMRMLFVNEEAVQKSNKILGTTTSIVSVILLAIFVLPIPSWSRAEGVVWMLSNSFVRAGTDCFITHVLEKDGVQVKKGQPLFACDAPAIKTEVEVLEARLREHEARYNAWLAKDRVQANVTKDVINTLQAELKDAKERQQKQIVMSPLDGEFVLPRTEGVQGKYVSQGDVLAYVTDSRVSIVRVVIEQGDIAKVRDSTKSIELRLSDNVTKKFTGMVMREIPAAMDVLPSPVLGSSAGGRILTDPADASGEKALQKFFQMDVALPIDAKLNFFGERVYVRFKHEAEPIAFQLYRAVRQLFIRSLGV